MVKGMKKTTSYYDAPRFAERREMVTSFMAQFPKPTNHGYESYDATHTQAIRSHEGNVYECLLELTNARVAFGTAALKEAIEKFLAAA